MNIADKGTLDTVYNKVLNKGTPVGIDVLYTTAEGISYQAKMYYLIAGTKIICSTITNTKIIQNSGTPRLSGNSYTITVTGYVYIYSTDTPNSLLYNII